MPAGIDAPSCLRRTVRVYRAGSFGLCWWRKTAYSERFRYTVLHVGWWYINFFTDLKGD